MPSNTLFAYSLEEQQGRLVITVQGSFAEAAVRQLRSQIAAGGGLGIISRLSPIIPLSRLVSAGVRLNAYGDTPPPREQKFDTNRLTHQGVDASFKDFQKQLTDFREALNAYKTRGTAKGRGRRRARKAAAAK